MSGPITGSAETLAEVVRDVLATCTCTPPPFGDGPQIDCPMHGRADHQGEAVTQVLLASDWMKRHDAEVRAEALREAADALIPFPSNDYGAFPWGAQSWLRDRAALTEESDRG